MNVLSLFDGISCGRVAFEKASININEYNAYEIDDNAIKISKSNYPDIKRFGDVFKADFSQHKDVGFLIGGSPCTYWSTARTRGGREVKNEGLGWELFQQYVRAFKLVLPEFFIYENNASISKEIKECISECLGVDYILINSGLVSAQNRRRCYWVGKKVGNKYETVDVRQPADKQIALYDVVDFSKEEFRTVGKWVYKSWGDKRKIDTLHNVNSKKSSTLTTSRVHPGNYYLNKEGTEYCNLTVKDWERLQTLPEGYVNNCDIKDTDKYKAIGNGWTVDVIAHIIKECLR